STNDLFLQTILLKIKQKRSLCHLCYRLLLLFLLKYSLFTFPQHFLQMFIHFKQFSEYILKKSSSNNNQNQNSIDEFIIIICRFLFLFARFGDCLLLTNFPKLIQKY